MKFAVEVFRFCRTLPRTYVDRRKAAPLMKESNSGRHLYRVEKNRGGAARARGRPEGKQEPA